MSKRFGAAVVTTGAARHYAYEARITGSDHADRAGACQSPVYVPVTGVRDKSLQWLAQLSHETSWPGTDYAPGHGWMGDHPETKLGDHAEIRHATIAVPCRNCEACFRTRASMWRRRARAETVASARTWFVTLTCRPEVHFRHTALAELKLVQLRTAGWDNSKKPNYISPRERWRIQCEPLLREHQLFMKRLRKSAPGLRYFLVVEEHKSGLPHLHMLLHESVKPVRWKDIDAAWHLGFHVSKLVGSSGTKWEGANYVTKYLTKSASILRSSLRYGKSDDDIVGSSPIVLKRSIF